MDESGRDEAEFCRKVANRRRVVGAIRSLISAKGLHIWKDMERKERSRIRVVQMDNLRGLLGIRRMDKVPNSRINELCGVTKGVSEKMYEGDLGWFGHVERMENKRNAKRVYAG